MSESKTEEIDLGPLLTPGGIRPAFVNKKMAAEYLSVSTAIIDRMLWASRHTDDKWLEIATNQEGDPKQMTLITTRSVEKAGVRICKEGFPPRIPTMSFFGRLWSFFTREKEEPVYDHVAAEKAQARESAELREKRDAAAREEERERCRQGIIKPEEERESIIVAPGLFPPEDK